MATAYINAQRSKKYLEVWFLFLLENACHSYLCLLKSSLAGLWMSCWLDLRNNHLSYLYSTYFEKKGWDFLYQRQFRSGRTIVVWFLPWSYGNQSGGIPRYAGDQQKVCPGFAGIFWYRKNHTASGWKKDFKKEKLKNLSELPCVCETLRKA